MNSRWLAGNTARLLENGEQFFPAVFDAIRAARVEVLLETFIVFEDKVGLALHRALVEAAGRGVSIDLLVDGFGSSELSENYVGTLAAAGVRVRHFDPGARWFGLRVNVLRRMHRKIVVVDGQRAFVGGINYSADHLADFGPEAKQDYAVELTGPIVAAIHAFLRAGLGTWPQHTPRHAPLPAAPADAAAKPVDALFVTRDNHAHRNDIERHYRIAIRSARRRVLIANAYFFPGYRLLRELRRAARRGVEVRLVLQGEPDMAIVKAAASLLYDCLRRDGVRVHEYCKRPLHGKVAVVDDEWATVGSSNLDPLSLALNLEANVVLRGREFALDLAERLEQLIRDDCQEVVAPLSNRWGPWQSLRSAVIFHVLRRFPSWASWLPRHVPRLHVALPFSGGRAPHLPRGEAAAGTGERAHAR